MEPKEQPQSPWTVTPEKVEAAIRRLVETARPRKLFLFGSYVNGQGTSDSDLDGLVVTDDSVENPRRESIRLRAALRDILMPVDILCVPESFFNSHRDSPGLIYREALKTGRLVYYGAA